MAKKKPPIFGMIQRGGEVVIRMLANVKQATIGPLIKRTVAEGTLVYTDAYDIYQCLAHRHVGDLAGRDDQTKAGASMKIAKNVLEA